jgi:hypothetical protein
MRRLAAVARMVSLLIAQVGAIELANAVVCEPVRPRMICVRAASHEGKMIGIATARTASVAGRSSIIDQGLRRSFR